MQVENNERPEAGWRNRLHEIVFESETIGGRIFDMLVIWLILLSLLAVVLESVREVRDDHGGTLYLFEWVFTILFTIEYILRLMAVRKPLLYGLSFFGLVDLLAILPTYISLFVPGTQYLLSIRILRLLRIFRILKLSEYISEGKVITTALVASRRKITVFLVSVLTIVTIVSTETRKTVIFRRLATSAPVITFPSEIYSDNFRMRKILSRRRIRIDKRYWVPGTNRLI